LSPAPGTESVTARMEIRLENRLQHQLQGRLNHPVPDGSDAQAAQLAVRLGNQPLPDRQRAETAVLQRRPQLTEEVPCSSPVLDGRRGRTVHSGSPGTL